MNDNEVRRRLENELEKVNREVVALKKEPRPEELEGLGDTTPLSEDVDAVSYKEIEELQSDRLGRLLDRAAALDQALHRVDEGTYGVCIECENPISNRRLEAVPEALRCTACQEEIEASPGYEKLRAKEWRRLAEEAYAEEEETE